MRFGYDSQGRRLWKTAYTYAGGAWAPSCTRHYLWDGNNLVAELDGNNAILTGYTWGPTGLLAVTDYSGAAGPVTYVVGQDLSGNVAALFDAVTGLPVASFKYDPYGNPAGASGPKKGLGLFRGKGLMVDGETPDIQHALMRDARGSQWLERDPAGELQGGLNLHQMYGGDPVNKSDPSGLTVKSYTINYDTPGTTTLNPQAGDLWEGKFRIVKVDDAREYYIWTPIQTTLYMLPSGTWVRATHARAVADDAKGGTRRPSNVWESGSLTVWYDDTPISSDDKHFESVLFQQQQNAERLAKTIQLGHDVGQIMDSALHLLPGAQLYLDLPEAITGKQLSTGSPLSAGEEAMSAGSVVFSSAGKILLDTIKARKLAKERAFADMLLEDIAELSEHDVKFYRGVHANSLESVAPAQGYILRDLDTLEPLKYGMTTREGGRYSKAELKKMNAFMDFVTDGSVADMRAWETKQIKDYVTGRGERPPYNHSDH